MIIYTSAYACVLLDIQVGCALADVLRVADMSDFMTHDD